MNMDLKINKRYAIENNISFGFVFFLTNKESPAILDGGMNCES